MDDQIVWFCRQLGSSSCYVLSSGEKGMYLLGFSVNLMAAVLLCYGTLIRFLTRQGRWLAPSSLTKTRN